MFKNFKIGRTVLIHGLWCVQISPLVLSHVHNSPDNRPHCPIITNSRYFVPPAILIGVLYPTMQTDEEKRKVLEEKYGEKIRAAEGSRKNMQEFFDKVKAGDEQLNQQLDQVLVAGNKKVVRHYALSAEPDVKSVSSGVKEPSVITVDTGSTRIQAR